MNKILFILPLACLLVSGCSDSKATQETAEAQGFTDVKSTGYSFFGCDEKDNYHTGFTARAQNGKCVEGVVCSGFLKGNTLRTTKIYSCQVN